MFEERGRGSRIERTVVGVEAKAKRANERDGFVLLLLSRGLERTLRASVPYVVIQWGSSFDNILNVYDVTLIP